MSDLLATIQRLVVAGDYQVSTHGDQELANDRIALRDVIVGVGNAKIVEEYPTFHKGPCVLALQYDLSNKPLHILWGLRKNTLNPAVLITAYRPKRHLWSDDFLTRRK